MIVRFASTRAGLPTIAGVHKVSGVRRAGTHAPGLTRPHRCLGHWRRIAGAVGMQAAPGSSVSCPSAHPSLLWTKSHSWRRAMLIAAVTRTLPMLLLERLLLMLLMLLLLLLPVAGVPSRGIGRPGAHAASLSKRRRRRWWRRCRGVLQ